MSTMRPPFSSVSDEEIPGDLPKIASAKFTTKPLPGRAHLTSAIQHRLARSSARSGFALGELLIVFVAIGLATACMLAIVPTGDDEQGTAETPPTIIEEVEVLHDHEVQLGDDYVCVVKLFRIERPQTRVADNHFCRVRIARRHPSSSEPFLIDIVASQRTSWYVEAEYCTWMLFTAEAGQSFLEAHRQAALEANGLPKQLQQIHRSFYCPPDLAPASLIDEAVSCCVPAPLRESGVFVTSKMLALRDIHQAAPDLPLHQVVSAIRSAAERDHWTVMDLPTLFDETPLAIAEEDTVAHSLVYGLLDYLPQGSVLAH